MDGGTVPDCTSSDDSLEDVCRMFAWTSTPCVCEARVTWASPARATPPCWTTSGLAGTQRSSDAAENTGCGLLLSIWLLIGSAADAAGAAKNASPVESANAASGATAVFQTDRKSLDPP